MPTREQFILVRAGGLPDHLRIPCRNTARRAIKQGLIAVRSIHAHAASLPNMPARL